MRIFVSKAKPFTKPKAAVFVIFYLLFIILLFSCSSAPSRPAEVFTIRNLSQSQLNLANQTASRGRYEEALALLTEARRLAISADDPALRIKTSISRGNVLFSLGFHDEAFIEFENAAAEAEISGDRVLASLARTYTIRSRLLQLEASNDRAAASSAAELKTRLERELPNLRPDPLATAAGYVTLGMAEKLLGNWNEAERAIKSALDIHEKGLYLEDAAYNWFLIASVRSVAGNHNGALEALREAISLDRRVENSYGLASSWQAMGDVYQKMGRTAESRDAWFRAAEIFRAINLNSQAQELEKRLENS